ncbi:MAG: hypothetical protein HC788_09400 [Sphingopyxis sp.]|nr:hypothetical protein [Sphingopyxis sp.]
MKMHWLINGVTACTVIGLALTSASPAAARNRTSEMLIADIAARAGVSYNTALERMDSQQGEDVELLPGIFVSSGAFAYSYRGEAVSMSAVRIFNETGFAICVRARAALTGGPMVGSRQAGNLGFNFVVEPGTSESVIMHVADRHAFSDLQHYANAYYFWSALPGGDQRCSPVAPGDLDSFDRAALPPGGQFGFRSAPELAARLGVASPQSGWGSPAPAPPAAQAANYVPPEQRTSEWVLGLFNHSRGLVNGTPSGGYREMSQLGSWGSENGPFLASFAAVTFGNGTFGAMDALFNNSDKYVCLFIAGDTDGGLDNPVKESGSRGPKVVRPYSLGEGAAFYSSTRLRKMPSAEDWTLRYLVWAPPSTRYATDADCAAGFDVAGNAAALMSAASPGQVVVHNNLR